MCVVRVWPGSLLDSFHDLNKMICQRYKRANGVSRDLLLKTLHLERPHAVSTNCERSHRQTLTVKPFLEKTKSVSITWSTTCRGVSELCRKTLFNHSNVTVKRSLSAHSRAFYTSFHAGEFIAQSARCSLSICEASAFVSGALTACKMNW